MAEKFDKNLPKQAFVTILKEQGALRVSEDAADKLRKLTEEHIQLIGKQASQYARHAKRNTILPEDVELAMKHSQ